MSAAQALTLVECKGEARVDSRILAGQLSLQHQNVFEMLKDYQADFEELGLLRFETGKVTKGRPQKFGLLNEDQCYLLLSFSRNTPTVRALKVNLVKAFKQARAGQEMHAIEYLPGYHQLHDLVHQLAAGSPNERFVHMNLNKLVNSAVGISAGQRSSAPAPVRALTVVAQTFALKAMEGAQDHREGYALAKHALQAFGALSLAGTGK